MWTDAHWGKRSLGAVGVVFEIADAPPQRTNGEPKDGRRRRPRTVEGLRNTVESSRSEGNIDDGQATNATAAPRERSVKVCYAGRHGRPSVELWYPESSLADVPPPAFLRELCQRAERVEDDLHAKQGQLQVTQEEYTSQQRRWMGEAD